MAEISSFRNPGLFYAVLPFGLNPVAENDGSLAAICAKSASSSGVDIGAATSGGVDDDDESNQNLQAALSEFYRYVGLDSFCNLYTIVECKWKHYSPIGDTHGSHYYPCPSRCSCAPVNYRIPFTEVSADDVVVAKFDQSTYLRAKVLGVDRDRFAV